MLMSVPSDCRRFPFLFFFNDTATTEIYTLSLHDALPIYRVGGEARNHHLCLGIDVDGLAMHAACGEGAMGVVRDPRSEEHTSELQSPCNLVCRLLLEKKKMKDGCEIRCHNESG